MLSCILVSRQVLHIDSACCNCLVDTTLARNINRLAQPFLQALERVVEVECAALLELHATFELTMLWRYATACDGMDDSFPLVCAKPGSRDARVCDIEDRDGEGLEGRCGGDR